MVLQRWRDVTFVHWDVDPARLARAVPRGLELDPGGAAAGVGLTPFSTTSEVLGGVPVPGPRSFPETNLRTYVRGPDGSDGLYFLSLDVTNRSNAAMGPLLGRPSDVGGMVIDQQDGAASTIRYAGTRRHRQGMVAYDITIEVLGDQPVAVDAVDTFLTGRWSAYFRAGTVLFRCDVEHEPWPLCHA